MPRIPLADLGDTTADRILGHRPELLDAWASLRQALVGPSSTLSPHLKEEVRRTVAQHTGCAYCASLGKPEARQQDEKKASGSPSRKPSPPSAPRSAAPR
jgi:AhpD family alkylhydroperoxidase